MIGKIRGWMDGEWWRNWRMNRMTFTVSVSPSLPWPCLPLSLYFPFPFFFISKFEQNPAITRNGTRCILQPDLAICSIATGLKITSSCLNLSHKQECLTMKKTWTLVCLLLLTYLISRTVQDVLSAGTVPGAKPWKHKQKSCSNAQSCIVCLSRILNLESCLGTSAERRPPRYRTLTKTPFFLA